MRFVYGAAALLVALTIAAFVWVRARRGAEADYKEVQGKYNDLLARRGLGSAKIPIQPRERVARWEADAAGVSVPRAERCESCHLGAAGGPKLEGDDVLRLFKPHSGAWLDTHPAARFGCTSCHRGRAEELSPKAHAADSWQRSSADGAFEWDVAERAPSETMLRVGTARKSPSVAPGALPVPYEDLGPFAASIPEIEASCATCHPAASALREPKTGKELAPTLARGQRLYQELRCGSCHDGPLGVEPPSFSLDDVGLKARPEWLLSFVRDPKKTHPKTTMPNAWPPPIDPATGQRIAEGPERAAWEAKMKSESSAIVAFLLARTFRELPSASPDRSPPPESKVARYANVPGATAGEGAALEKRLGCDACHAAGGAERSGAPSLDDASERMSEDWMAWFLEDPSRASGPTGMPSLRLTRREAASVAKYLASRGAPPTADDVANGRTERRHRDVALPAPDGLADVATARARAERVRCSVDDAEMTRAECGERLFLAYGCRQCHSLSGIAPRADFGPSLAEFARKESRDVDWGPALEGKNKRSHDAYRTLKLEAPRVFAYGKRPMRMPSYDLSADEIAALSVVLESFGRGRAAMAFDLSTREGAREAARGEALMTSRRCVACHAPGGDARLGPSLAGEGKRVQPAWIVAFLRDPQANGVRPAFHPEWTWGELTPPDRQTARCPTYALSVEEASAIARALAVRDGASYPFVDTRSRRLAPDEKLEAVTALNKACLDCHFVGDLPRDRGKSGAPLGPPLGGLAERLRPEWTLAFLSDPKGVIPGAPCPKWEGDKERARGRDLLFSLPRQARLPKKGEEARSPLP